MRPRVFASITAGAIAGILLTANGANAQSLQRLHVQTLTLSADTATPELEVPFHLTIHARVTEPVQQLRNLELPEFDGLESLGDQRSLSATPKGTQYDEVLTVVAHQSGTINVSPAYLDAIDGRDGKPKRFLSNSLRLNVGRGTLSPVNAVATFFGVLFRVALGALLLVAAIFVLVAIFRRRPAPVAPAVEPPVEVFVEPPDPDARVRKALQELRASRDRAHVLHLRAVLWQRSGVPAGATLADFLIAEPNVARRTAARAVEVAAFVDNGVLERYIDEAVRATEGAV